jgi:hypothetical protein
MAQELSQNIYSIKGSYSVADEIQSKLNDESFFDYLNRHIPNFKKKSIEYLQIEATTIALNKLYIGNKQLTPNSPRNTNVISVKMKLNNDYERKDEILAAIESRIREIEANRKEILEISPNQEFKVQFGLLKDRGNGVIELIKETDSIPMTYSPPSDTFHGFMITPKIHEDYEIQRKVYLPSNNKPQNINIDGTYSTHSSSEDVIKFPVIRRDKTSYLKFFCEEGDICGNYKIELTINNKMKVTKAYKIYKR